MMNRCVKLGLLTFLVASPVFAGPPVFSLLETSRSKIKLPVYSTADKRLVLEQVKLILNDVYVHRELKLKDFGANPAPALKVIEENLETISDLNFHKSMYDIFATFRDKHTLYYLPRPHACYNNFLPFNLREVLDDQNKAVIAVSSLELTEQIIKLIKTHVAVVPGDILVSIDGLPVEEALKQAMPDSFGANEPAARRGAIDGIIFKEHHLDFVPEKDTSKLVFKNRFGKIYTQELPWITKTKWDCMAKAQGDSSNKSLPVKAKKQPKRLWGGNVGEETIFRTKIIENQYGEFGYLRLSSFEPEVISIPELILKFRDVLKNDFANTDGLIIDIRDNAGGDISIAERMLQLVSPKEIRPMTDIMKVTAANLHYMEHVSPYDPFTLAIHEAMQTGAAYTRPLALVRQEEMNDLGQFYFKPVVIFTNSYCYSSCDMLAAQMQDYKLATIFGEDETTGAGGANRFNLDKWLDDLGMENGPFERLPKGQDLMFAFRQTFRTGINAGKLVENAGITSDRLAKPTMADLFNADADQLRIIGKFINQQSPNYSSWANLPSDDRQDIVQGEKTNLLIKWADTSSITFKDNGRHVEATDVERNKPDGQPFALPVDNQSIKSGRLEILGSKDNNPAWRKIYNYRVVPVSLPVAAPMAITANQFALYTTNVAPDLGWNVTRSGLQLGNGIYYQDQLHAEASLFVTLSNASVLSFNAEIQTELDCDILQVLVISEGKATLISDKLSGSIPNKNYKFDLSAFAGKKIELRFVFNTDGYIAGPGITISDISLGTK